MREQIKYLGFWDVPRLFTVKHKGKIYLFDCRFDDELDEYPDIYKVYLLSEGDLDFKKWEESIKNNASFLGEIEVANVEFDSSKRKEIEMDCLQKLTKNKRGLPTI